MIFHWANLGLSTLVSALRLGAGAAAPVSTGGEPVIIYEFEGCPFCRVAREAVSDSGAPALIRPCPKGGKRFRPMVKTLGGKTQFPFLVDPNNEMTLYESADIAAYLHERFGGSRSPIRFLGPFNHLLSQFGVLLRLMGGTFAKRSRAPERPLEFFGAERDPRARLAKELLSEMEIEYLWRARGTGGEGAAPRLFDPNAGETRIGARAIRQYLLSTYRP